MDKKVVKIAQEFSRIVVENLEVRFVILFGSFAKGTQKEESDIDIAVVVEKANGKYLDISTLLFHLVKKVDLRIEPLLIEIENDKSGFLESLLKSGKIIYKN
ncbi:MAG: nucleotidyltransferase domain-containing protein [Ignavibacteriales bacterium]|nr:nucleotidyltransferase domain-containing protein [Ignavibacteriales bacterium]